MKIFTRRGDRGESSLLSGERASKDDVRFDAVGSLDELQSHLGLLRAIIPLHRLKTMIFQVQTDLFIGGSQLASTSQGMPKLLGKLGAEHTAALEDWIDELTDRYGLPGHFVIPGNSPESAQVHVARSVCRRCERRIVSLNRNEEGVYGNLVTYFNRLSDLLFVLAWVLDVRATVKRALGSLMSEDGGGRIRP